MSEVINSQQQIESLPGQSHDIDPIETQEWIDSLMYVINSRGPDRAKYLISFLEARARQEGVELPIKSNTPYINSIPVERQVAYPGNRELERRIKSVIRWNAMVMVARANKMTDGIGGHISTFASSATLYEVAYNHFFRGRGDSEVAQRLPQFENTVIGLTAKELRNLAITPNMIPELKPIDDVRATAIYRKDAAAILTRNAVLAAMGDGQ